MRGARARLLLPLACIACGEEVRTQREFTPALERISVTADSLWQLTPIVSASAATPNDRAAAVFAIRLTTNVDAPFAGVAAIQPTSGGSRVTTTLHSLPAGITFSGAIRRGRCEQYGSIIEGLVPVSADSAGAGRSATDIEVTIPELVSGPRSIAFGRGGRPEVCGNLPLDTAALAQADSIVLRPLP